MKERSRDRERMKEEREWKRVCICEKVTELKKISIVDNRSYIASMDKISTA